MPEHVGTRAAAFFSAFQGSSFHLGETAEDRAHVLLRLVMACETVPAGSGYASLTVHQPWHIKARTEMMTAILARASRSKMLRMCSEAERATAERFYSISFSTTST